MIKNLFKSKSVDKSSYYYRYMHQARLFEGIGVISMALSILINELAGSAARIPVISFAGVGIVFLIIGGSSTQPHVAVKSFASLLRHDPNTKNAQEFIKALEYVGNVSLVKSSQTMVSAAVYEYEKSKDVDENVLNQLKKSLQEHIKNKLF